MIKIEKRKNVKHSLYDIKISFIGYLHIWFDNIYKIPAMAFNNKFIEIYWMAGQHKRMLFIKIFNKRFKI